MPVSQVVFSEAEVEEIGIKIDGATEVDSNKCVGTLEEEMTVKTVTKKCRGVVEKSRTKGTGNGTLKLSLHMEQDIFADIFGMTQEGLKDGVIAYGKNSLHKVFCMTVKVLDEDDNVKYKAYPKCSIQTGFSRKVENGAEEISEIELEIAVTPDKNGNGLYEVLEADITEDELKTAWMKNFAPELVKKASV